MATKRTEAAFIGQLLQLRHRDLYDGKRVSAAVVVGLYSDDPKHLIVQAFAMGRPVTQYEYVSLAAADPGPTLEATAWPAA